MSKSKRFCIYISKTPLKSEFSNQNMKVLFDNERARTRIPEMSPMSRKYAARKLTTLPRGISPSGSLDSPKTTPCKSEKAPIFFKPESSPKPRLFVSKKYPSLMALRGRIAAGGSGKRAQASKCGEPETTCKAAKNCEHLESCSKPKPVAIKSSCCVAFQEPVASDMPSCVQPIPLMPDQPKQEAPVKQKRVTLPKESRGCCKRPLIVVTKKHHKRKEHHRGSPLSTITSHHLDHIGHAASSPNSQNHDAHEPPKSSRSYIPYIQENHSRSSQDSPHRDPMQHHRSSLDSKDHDDPIQYHRNSSDSKHHDDHIQYHRNSSDSKHHVHIQLPESSPDCHNHDPCEPKPFVICSDSPACCSDSPHQDPHCSTIAPSPPCDSNCPMTAEVEQQLAKFTQKLEDLQSHELSEIRKKIEDLNDCVKVLTQKCEAKREPEPLTCASLERKSLSTCQFCQGRDLPLLDSFHVQLMEKIGHRSFTDVLMSVFLRADNIYHVNVRDMNSGSSLCCFLVTDEGIEEAQQLGLFQEILTFSVIDVRNTLKPRNCALGITFELVLPERQKGGSDSLSRGICMACKPFVARVLGLPLDQLKYLYGDLENTNNYPERSLKRFRSRIERIQASSVRKSRKPSKVKTRTGWKV